MDIECAFSYGIVLGMLARESVNLVQRDRPLVATPGNPDPGRYGARAGPGNLTSKIGSLGWHG